MQTASPSLRIALGYRRVSSKSQEDNFSLLSQDDDIREYCVNKGMILDGMFTDVGSGLSTKHRDEFIAMCDRAMEKNNGVTDVVINELDRYTRSIRDFFKYTDTLLEAGIHVHFALEAEEYDFNTAEKLHLRAVAAEGESKRISRRTKRGQRKATLAGKHMGPAPWAYILKDGKLVIDPELWPHCLKLWKMAKEGHTPMQIAVYNRLHNVPSPSGSSEKWTDASVRSILRNTKYYGQLYRGREPKSRIPGPKDNMPETVYENAHTAAVTFDDFEEINKGIDSRHMSEGPAASHTSPNLLSNKLKCGECASQGRNSNLNITDKAGDTRRLRCGWKKSHGDDTCIFTGARLDRIMEAVTDRLMNHFLTPDVLESIIEGVAEKSADYLTEHETSRAGISDRLKTVKEEIDSGNAVLLEAQKEGKNLTSLIHHVDGLEREKEKAEKELAGIAEVTKETLLYVNDREGIIETVMSRKMFLDPEDPKAMRKVLNTFIRKVDIFQDGHGVICYNLPTHSGESEDTPATETIHLEKRRGSKKTKSSVLTTPTGLG